MEIGNLSIGTRLGAGFAIVLFLATISSAMGLWRQRQVATAPHAMMQAPLTNERMTQEWYHMTFAGHKRQLPVVRSADPRLGEYFAADANASTSHINEIRRHFESHLASEQERALFQQVVAFRVRYLADNLFRVVGVFKLTDWPTVASPERGAVASPQALPACTLRHEPVATLARAVPAAAREAWEAY